MSGNPETFKQIPVIIQLPENYGGDAESIAELKEIVGELRELLKSASAPISLTEVQLADYFECSLIWLQRQRRAGKIKFKRVGNAIHYSRRHIEDFLNSGDCKK